GTELNGFFAHLEHDRNDKRMELRFVLDVSTPSVGNLIVLPLHLEKGGVAEGVAAMLRVSARQINVSMQAPEGLTEELVDHVSPLVSLVLYLCSQAAEIRDGQGGNRLPSRPQAVKTKKGVRLFPPDRPNQWEVGYRLGAALRRAWSEHEPAEPTATHPSPRPHLRQAHW